VPVSSTKTIKPVSIEVALIASLSVWDGTLGGMKPPKCTLSELLLISKIEARDGFVVPMPTCEKLIHEINKVILIEKTPFIL